MNSSSDSDEAELVLALAIRAGTAAPPPLTVAARWYRLRCTAYFRAEDTRALPPLEARRKLGS